MSTSKKCSTNAETCPLIDYKICLALIDRLLRQHNPYTEPSLMSKEMYRDLYDQMATNNVPEWDSNTYGSPKYFLQLLRRHVFTGAFSHPKYGGNIGATGWAYLEEKYRDKETGQTLFNWRRIMEKPLGDSSDYHG
jgi:Gluconate 2-dehydrogenase subunit 3